MKSAADILASSEKFLIKLGLERVEKVLGYLGNPQNRLKAIHVAGTNGKGSVCAVLAAITRANGFKTGLFTSPHLFSYCERIKINDEEISTNKLDELVSFIINASKECGVELTEFEILTVAAFYYFFKEKVDFVVLETGLGGRLDATNVVEKPLACVITSISHDHMDRLGNTIEEIAREKAGIIKENSSVFISPENLGYDVILAHANTLGAKVMHPKKCEIRLENWKNYALYGDKCFEFPLLGRHQGENLALALRVVDYLDMEIKGLERVEHRFRLEYDKEKKLLIDGCHNLGGAQTLRNFLDEIKCGGARFIYGSLKNKEYEKILKTLVREDDELYIYEFNNPNALKFVDLPEYWQAKARKAQDPRQLINDGGTEKLTVVCGSLYMLGEIFKEF